MRVKLYDQPGGLYMYSGQVYLGRCLKVVLQDIKATEGYASGDLIALAPGAYTEQYMSEGLPQEYLERMFNNMRDISQNILLRRPYHRFRSAPLGLVTAGPLRNMGAFRPFLAEDVAIARDMGLLYPK